MSSTSRSATKASRIFSARAATIKSLNSRTRLDYVTDEHFAENLRRPPVHGSDEQRQVLGLWLAAESCADVVGYSRLGASEFCGQCEAFPVARPFEPGFREYLRKDLPAHILGFSESAVSSDDDGLQRHLPPFAHRKILNLASWYSPACRPPTRRKV